MQRHLLLILSALLTLTAQAITYTGADIYKMLQKNSLIPSISTIYTRVEGTDFIVTNATSSGQTYKFTIKNELFVGHLAIDADASSEDSHTELETIQIGSTTVAEGRKLTSYEGDFTGEGYSGDVSFEYYLDGPGSLIIHSVTINEATRQMAWSETNVTAVMGEAFTFPSLSLEGTSDIDFNSWRFDADFTFSSSNPAVARVMSHDGKQAATLVMCNEGETDITASYPATDNYPAASATFHLTVLPISLSGSSETIHLDEPGTLALKLTDLESTDIRRLKLTGNVGSADLSTIRKAGRLSDLRELDLSEATLCYDDGEYASIELSGELGHYTIHYYLSATERIEDVTNVYSPHLSGAFMGMTSLRRVLLPQSITRIGERAFSGCTSLAEVVMPAGIDYVDELAFSGCTRLAKLNLGKLNYVGDNAFNKSTISSVDLSEATHIGAKAFRGCPLTEVNLSALDTIAQAAFDDCTMLQSVTLGSNLRVINAAAFADTPLSSITLPDGLESIGSFAFGRTMLSEVNVPASVLHLNSDAFHTTPWETAQRGNGIDGVIYAGHVAMGIDPGFSIPEGWTLTLRNGTTAIAEGFNINSSTDADRITALSLPATLKYAASATYPLTNLASVTLPESIEEIGTLFAHSSIREITIPATVTTIHDHAFMECQKLVRLTYRCPRAQGAYIFSNCTGMDKAIIGAEVESLPPYIFNHCTSLLKVEFEGRDYRNSLQKAARAPYASKSPFHVSDCAFYRCSALTMVDLPWETDSIGNAAFGGCESLATFYLTPGLRYVESFPPQLSVLYNYMPVPYDITRYFLMYGKPTVYVLPDSYDAYRAHLWWGKFDIQPMDDAHISLGINEAQCATDNEGISYDLRGIRTNANARGVIIRNGRKMIVR